MILYEYSYSIMVSTHTVSCGVLIQYHVEYSYSTLVGTHTVSQ